MIVPNVNCARRQRNHVPGQHICHRALTRDAVIGFNVGFVSQFKGLPLGNHSIMPGIAQPIMGKQKAVAFSAVALHVIRCADHI